MKIAIFPGSFDPITIGHVNIIERALPLFDKIIIAIGVNTQKKYFYPLEQRVAWLNAIFESEDKVEVDSYEGLTVTYCQKIGAKYIVRGLRNSTDFDFEKTIAQMNVKIGDGIETVFLMSDPALSPISSSILREIIKSGGDASAFLPKEVKNG